MVFSSLGRVPARWAAQTYDGRSARVFQGEGPSSGVMASGQVVGMIDDLPTCKELIDRIISEAETTLKELGA